MTQVLVGIVMGSDSFQNLGRWKNAEVIIRDHRILVYKRPGFETENIWNARVEFMNAPLLEISATHIRELIKNGKSIKYLVPAVVEHEILEGGYFRKNHKHNPAKGSRPQ